MKYQRTIASVVLLLPVSAGRAWADASEWEDTFYQYRVPVTIETDSAGWQEIPLTAADIVSAINTREELKYDSRWFAYNHVKIVNVDEAGTTLNEPVEAGFHLIVDEHNHIDPEFAAKKAELEVNVEPGAMYLLRYTASGAGGSPVRSLEPIFPVLHRLRSYAALISHDARVLPLGQTEREVLIIPNTAILPLKLNDSNKAIITNISLHRCDIRMLANLPTAGTVHWMLYYQPMTGHFLTIPDLRRPSLPTSMTGKAKIEPAERYEGNTRYPVGKSDGLSVWFAETTVKLTPSTPPPTGETQPIRITAAANEAQSFQLVLRPQKPVDFPAKVTSSDLVHGEHQISGDRVTAQEVDFVPITEPSYLSPTRYRGPLADPLLKLSARSLSPVAGNFVLWMTVNVPSGTPAGAYSGTLTLALGSDDSMDLPFIVEVYGFELPAISPFRSSMGGAHMTKSIGDSKTIADYHQAFSRAEIRELAHNYFDVMAENKFTPHSVAQYSKIGMEWTPPPQGFNVDAPGNFISLHDWDFTEFNEDLRHYMDELKVNAFTLVHTNPSVIMRFKHLPGESLAEYDRHPHHSSLDWQNWRKMTYVGYDKREDDDYIEITRNQYDHLVMQFYRKIAENLDAHGWLDYAYVLVDETAYRGYEPLLHFIRLMKSDPLTARIRIAWCIQGMSPFNYRSNETDPNYAFNDLLDIYVPEINENVHYWQPYFFSDYHIKPKREKLWNYVTYTARVAIDVPGINNRVIPLEVFNNGGGGFMEWATFIWDSQAHHHSNHSNPWEQPYTRWGNGAMAYFYPPRKSGAAPSFDPTVTPSLRVMTYREGVDDYEYAWLLEQLIHKGREQGVDVSAQQQVLDDIQRFFPSMVHWSQNDAWYLELRDRLARAIEALAPRIASSQSGTE